MSLNNPALVVTDLPAGAIAQTFERRNWIGGAASTSGRLALSAIWLRAGTSVSSISFLSTGTALSGGSHAWAALYDGSLNLLAQSANDTSPTWAANTKKTFTLSSPVAITVTGWYYVGISIVATTMPTLATIVGAITQLETPAMGGWSTTGLTGTAPSTANVPISAAFPYAYVS